ncbi:MAG: CDP-diacylglycerol--glycerol-3-phosphate 3-phosphatidyltransferase [Treponema sp.]|nr:CDP-diacylglycerol--glycerol-3-phosphate 3-phosphatidyltransferase [Treponema sp.]
MTLADKITSSRLIISPLFFLLYYLPRLLSPLPASAFSMGAEAHQSYGPLWTIPVLWLLFIGSSITDMLDGMVARKQGAVSDFGKLYDPFADTLAQISFFLCFVLDGFFHPFLFLLVLYREFGILFLRNLMLKKGVSLGARMGGKIKTVSYISAIALALLASSALRLGFTEPLVQGFRVAAGLVFLVSVIIAIVSFFDYLSVYRKTPAPDA